MRAIYELYAFVDEGGKKKPFYLRISEPQASFGGENFYCRIHAPELFKGDKDIFGVDEAQARELAGRFTKSLLEGKQLTDNAGQPIDVGQLKI